MKIFSKDDKVVVPWNGQKIDAIVVDVLNTMLFVKFEQGGEGFVFQAEASKTKNDK
jgi:ribosomal protein S1